MRRFLSTVMVLWAAVSVALWLRRLREGREDAARG
jgi:hypothetical protein